LKFAIVTVGKIREDFIQKGVGEFSRRIGHYAELNFYPIKEERIIKGMPESQIVFREGKRILSKILRDGLWVALDRKGKELNSRQHFTFLNSQSQYGIKKIYYLFGGPLGLSAEVLNRSDLIFSLSRMTLTHEMSVLFLLEQLYRYLNFMAGEKYHK
jgi:23S rRNA (pseudouridine1915-N3)-methyltransferase